MTARVAFFLVASNAKLVREHQLLIEESATSRRYAAGGRVLDTLNRSIDGSESKDQDMGAYLDAASAIQRAFECVVLIVHHCGVDGHDRADKRRSPAPAKHRSRSTATLPTT